jgi:ABC-type branched-subunit amino acid transport system substrate-binding protein
MPRLHPVYCLWVIFAFFLASCEGGGYRPWDYGSETPKEAEAPPRALADGAPDAFRVEESAPVEGVAGEILVPPAPSLRPVKVGLLLPLSGPQAALGQAMLQAAQMAVFDAGHERFELLPRDAGLTEDAARAAAQSAVDAGAELILGPVFADSVRVAREPAQKAGLNMIAFSTDWALAGGNTYIMGFLPFDQVRRIGDYIAAQGLRHVGVLAPDTDYGRAVASAWQAVARQKGLPPAAISYFPSNAADLGPAVAKLAAHPPEATAHAIRPGAGAGETAGHRAVRRSGAFRERQSGGRMVRRAFPAPARGFRTPLPGSLWERAATSRNPGL